MVDGPKKSSAYKSAASKREGEEITFELKMMDTCLTNV